MKVLVQRISARPDYAKALEWGKLVVITGGVQILVQALGLVGGILIIRLLPTQEYAMYTLANTMLGTMIVLADAGISTGVMAQGGKVWQDRERLGVLMATGLNLRTKFAIGSLVVAVPILFYMLQHNGASWLTTVLIIASLIPAFAAGLSNSMLQVVPRLRQDITPLQKNQFITSLARLALLALLLFPFSWAFVAILAAGIPLIWSNRELRKQSSKYADPDQPADPEVRKDLLAFVKRVLPGSIYYCFSGQITIWLISVFGSSTAIAQIGALGRLAMMLNVLNVLFGTLIAPRFARVANNPKLLMSRYLQIQVGLLLLSVGIVGTVWLFPSQVLWILGKSYANLESEVVLNITSSCLLLIAGASYTILTSRGWAIKPVIAVTVSVGTLLLGIFMFDVSSITGILMINIFVAAVELLMYWVYTGLKIKQAGN